MANGNHGWLWKLVPIVIAVAGAGFFLIQADSNINAKANMNKQRIGQHDIILEKQEEKIEDCEDTDRELLEVLHRIDVNQNVMMRELKINQPD